MPLAMARKYTRRTVIAGMSAAFVARADAQALDVTRVADGFEFTEGPVWTPAGTLLFGDLPKNRIHEFHPGSGSVATRLENTNRANGLAFDASGRLTMCEVNGRRVSRLLPDGSRETIIDAFEGRRLNSPNDLVFDEHGGFYFTDPPYGVADHERQLPFCGVYYVASNGKTSLVSDVLDRPNGIALSPDETTLYVSNSAPERRVWMRFSLTRPGVADSGQIFASVPVDAPRGAPDGFKVDQAGNLVASGADGIFIISHDGKITRKIAFPEKPANCAFGGPDLQTLYVTARNALYARRLEVPGKPLLRIRA